ncbi:MAG TPA: xanthine dehydrogenase family protein subunit M [Candidatus Acidoferrales bacterium]|nr:xanthine dehydrogenase family protein subunit M [Candidatus Acidoferrales bacterium]HEV2341878.1 xanthine dehydrogenase family protein subunit M [Candidatus Acidoferrales bacterium]
MIPAEFEYESPSTLDEALRLLGRHGDEAKILAGGHSLLPMMKLRLAAPRYVVDIGRLRGMDYIREEKDKIAIGALVTHAQVAASELLRERCPLLPETATVIGDMQVRNRGTIGGSLAHADPAADYPAAILALDAEMIVQSSSGKRTIPAEKFFVDLLATGIRPGEILTEIRVPVRREGEGSAYRKFHQPASGFAIVGAAARLMLGKGGKIEEIALGMTGVGSKTYRASAVEKALRGKIANDKLIAESCAKAAQGVDPLSDIFASADYRREMAAVFARRAIAAAIERAASKPSAAPGPSTKGKRK